MTKVQKLKDLNKLLEKSKEITTTTCLDPKFKIWKDSVEETLMEIFGNDSFKVKKFKQLKFYYPMFGFPNLMAEQNIMQHVNYYKSDFETALGLIKRCKDQIQEEPENESSTSNENLKTKETEIKDKSKEVIIDNLNDSFNKQNPTVANNDPDKLLSITEASEFLDLAKQTIYGYTSKNVIPHIKRGKKLYFNKIELIDWLKEGKQKTISEMQQEATSKRKK